MIMNDHETFSKLLYRTSQIFSSFLTIQVFKQVNEVFWGKRSSNVIKAFHLNVPRSFEKDCKMKM